MAWEDIQKYDQHFSEKSTEIKSGPVENRTCTQWGCIIVFAIMFLATIGGGAYFINAGKTYINTMVTTVDANSSFSGIGYVMAKLSGPIVGMLAVSVTFSILTILLGKSYPKQTIYILGGFTFLVYIGLIILGFVINSLALAISFIVMAVITGIMLFCFWSYISIGLKMLECASRFISEKPAVYFISFMCMVFNVLFIVFWVFSWLGVYSLGTTLTGSDKNVFSALTILWYVSLVFWGFFFYYCMTFLIASACAYWYYQSQNNSVLRGINNIKYHLGSITFGTVVITIITVLRMLASGNKSDGPARIIACLVQCLLNCIEDFLKVLNNNAFIVMSVTGEGYIDCAKSTISLIFNNLPLFIIIDYFTNFYNLFAAVFIGLVPAIIGAGIIYQVESSAGNLVANMYALWGGIIIFVLALVITAVVIGMLNQALSCIYIFYCFDKKFRSMGMEAKNIPKEIQEIFDEGLQDPDAMQATQMYLHQQDK